MNEEKELVNHPAHYNREGRKECIEEFIDKYGTDRTVLWALMTAEKYLYRIGLKDDAEVELKKIHWYINFIEKKYSSCRLFETKRVVQMHLPSIKKTVELLEAKNDCAAD